MISNNNVNGAKIMINHSKEIFLNGFLGPGKLISKENGYPKT